MQGAKSAGLAHPDAKQRGADDDEGEEEAARGDPAEHEGDEQDVRRMAGAGVARHLGTLQEDVIDVVRQEDEGAHLRQAAGRTEMQTLCHCSDVNDEVMLLSLV